MGGFDKPHIGGLQVQVQLLASAFPVHPVHMLPQLLRRIKPGKLKKEEVDDTQIHKGDKTSL